jgi:hypothetical protein
MTQNRRNHVVTLQQATKDSPTLSRLADLAMESKARLESLAIIIPPALFGLVKPGPIDGTTWCLVLENSSVASKIRQLIPIMQSHLISKGWQVTAIRIKIQTLC